MLLRKIERKKWIDDPSLEWLASGEFQADPLGDLATDSGSLSIWHVGNGCDQELITTALAASRNRVSDLDYFLIDEDALEDHGFKLMNTPGSSVDRALNRSCHFDIVELSESGLLRLSALLRSSATRETRIFPVLAKPIADAVVSERIKRGALGPRVDEKLVAMGLLEPRE